MSARLAVEQAYQCQAEHIRSEFVLDGLGTASVWEGMVEVFELSAPPPKTVFTWVVSGKKGPEWLIVPESKAVTSPASAVRHWLRNNGS